MLPSDGLYDLSSPTPGIVRGIAVRNGDELTAGRPVLNLGLADGSVKEVTSAIDGTILACWSSSAATSTRARRWRRSSPPAPTCTW